MPILVRRPVKKLCTVFLKFDQNTDRSLEIGIQIMRKILTKLPSLTVVDLIWQHGVTVRVSWIAEWNIIYEGRRCTNFGKSNVRKSVTHTKNRGSLCTCTFRKVKEVWSCVKNFYIRVSVHLFGQPLLPLIIQITKR